MKNTITLHVGYHKTGTTYLQNRIFSSHPDINFLGMPWQNDNYDQIIRRLKFTHPLDFNPEAFRSEILHEMDQDDQVKDSDSRATLISLESLHSGPEWFGSDIVQMTNRIHESFSPCKIILGIRNQWSYIVSNYNEYIIHGGKLSFKYFLNNSFNFNYALSAKLQYDKVISMYYELFGSENVHIYLHEELLKDPVLEINQMADFMGIKEFESISITKTYASMSRCSMEIIRFMNHLLAMDFNEQYFLVGRSNLWSMREKVRRGIISLFQKLQKTGIPKRICKKSYMTEQIKNEIRSKYNSSNHMLEKILGIDLEKYEYY